LIQELVFFYFGSDLNREQQSERQVMIICLS